MEMNKEALFAGMKYVKKLEIVAAGRRRAVHRALETAQTAETVAWGSALRFLRQRYAPTCNDSGRLAVHLRGNTWEEQLLF